MADTLRERIIQALVVKLGEIKTAYGYLTQMGLTVERAPASIDADSLPGIAVFPKVEGASKNYGKQVCTMPVEVRGLCVIPEKAAPAYPGERENASVIAEQMLGDLISCLIGTERLLTFTSGGTYQVLAGNMVTGETSGAHGVVVAVTLASGSWAGGTAAGTLRMKSQTGTFQAETLKVGTNLNVATIAANSSQTRSIDTAGGGLVDDISYAGGGVEDYPQDKDSTLQVITTFDVEYSTDIGNPYANT